MRSAFGILFVDLWVQVSCMQQKLDLLSAPCDEYVDSRAAINSSAGNHRNVWICCQAELLPRQRDQE